MTTDSIWIERAPQIETWLNEGRSPDWIAQQYDVVKKTLINRMAELRRENMLRQGMRESVQLKAPDVRTRQIEVDFTDKKNPAFDLDAYMKLKIEEMDHLQRKGLSQKEATVKLKTDKPVAIAFTADWHVGSAGVDYKLLFQHIQLIMDVPNLYFAAVGDMMDNFIKPKMKSATLHALFGPNEQKDVVQAIFERAGHKCLFYTAGNHDDWTDGESGIDIIESFSKGLVKAPYLRAGGGITLEFEDSDVNYRIYAKHKFSMNSRLNRSHGSKRMHELESPYDVGVLAHTHSPTVEHTERWSGAYGKDTIHIVTGTYKVEDYFGASNGFGANALAVSPTVIFFPEEKRMIPFFHIEDAVMMLRGLNASQMSV